MSFRGYSNDVDMNCGLYKPSKAMLELRKRLDKKEDLIIVIPVKRKKVFEDCWTNKNLKRIGIPYRLILTDANLPYVKSMNSILEILGKKKIAEAKYLMFTHSDITFLEKDWGKKVIRLCDSLRPKLGYAGVEAITFQGMVVGGLLRGKKVFRMVDKPLSVETCDDSIGIIPTELWLERGGFDEKTFLNYFFSKEDFACWVRLEKKLKVYALPIRINHGSKYKPRPKQDKWFWGHKSYLDYRINFVRGYDALCNKWGYQVNTTGASRRQSFPDIRKIMAERRLIDNAVIRRLKRTDLQGLQKFVERLSKESRDFWYPPSVQAIYNRNFKGNYTVIVACSVYGRIIGIAVYIHDKNYPDYPSISIAIDDAFHRLGLGTRLLTRLFNLAIKKGYEGVYVGVPKRHSVGIAFYKSLGFKMVGEKIAQDGKPAWEMKWSK